MKIVGAAFRRWFGGFRVAYLPVLLTYLCFGASMVTSIALLYFEKDTLGLTPGEAAGIAFWLGLPWSMKMVVGVAAADADISPADLRQWASLGVRGLRFNHFFRDGQLHYRGGVPLTAAERLAPVMAALGWHLQLWIDVTDLPETIPVLKALGLPVVIDHMGRTDARAGTQTHGFQSLLRAVGDGWCWARLSGAHRISRNAPDYPDARPFHEALVKANPERLVWGGDWPHPRVEGEMPDA